MINKRVVNLGELTERITIGNYGTTTDENCCIIKNWTEKFSILARVRKLSLKKTEILDKEGITSFNCKEFTFRNEFDLKYSDVIRWKNLEYNVIAMEYLDDQEQFLVVTAKRSVE